MADLIVAGTSGYATGTIDTASTVVNNVTLTDAVQPNGLAAAIVQVETILGLGTTLKGSVADLVARLAVGISAAGLLNLSTDAAVAGPLSVAKGGTGGTVGGTVGLVPAGVISAWGGAAAPTGYVLCDGTAYSRTITYGTLFAALGGNVTSTITVTIASPGVVSWASNPLLDGQPVAFTTTGALPTGISANTQYYVTARTASTFQISATLGGVAINTSGSQSGVHTAHHVTYGVGDNSTTFHVPDLRGRAIIMVDGAASRVTSASTNGANADTLGGVGGAETHTLVTAEMPAHGHGYHEVNGAASGSGQKYITVGRDADATAATEAIESAGSGTTHNNTQPWIALNYIIKF